MSKLWTRKRAAACVRDARGRFVRWRGSRPYTSKWGGAKSQQAGISGHIGREFVRQHGRVARVGEVVRRRRLDGAFHRAASWYVRTSFGWRKLDQYGPAPGAAVVRRVLAMSRKSSRGGR